MHTWCFVAALRQSLGRRAVHSRTASRLGVPWLGDRTIPVYTKKKPALGHARDRGDEKGPCCFMTGRQEEGPDPPRKSLRCALFSLPPPCWWSPHGAPPVRSAPHGTPQCRRALRLVFSSWRPGRTTTRGNPAGVTFRSYSPWARCHAPICLSPSPSEPPSTHGSEYLACMARSRRHKRLGWEDQHAYTGETHKTNMPENPHSILGGVLQLRDYHSTQGHDDPYAHSTLKSHPFCAPCPPGLLP